MLKDKTKAFLREKCLCEVRGKVAVVTGSNSGIGFKAAEELVFLGAKVVMACRNPQKAQSARQALLDEYPDASIDIYQLDIASAASIEAFAQRIEADGLDIHAFVNNAGILKSGARTQDDMEAVIGTNYIGTRRLTERILPYLLSLPHPVKIINASSILYKVGSIRKGDFFRHRRYNHFAAYSQSKLCITRYSLDLHRRLEGGNTDVWLSHPGIAITPIAAKAYGKVVGALAGVSVARIFQSPEKSALAIPYIIANDLPSGKMYGPAGLLDSWGYPAANRILPKAYGKARKALAVLALLLACTFSASAQNTASKMVDASTDLLSLVPSATGFVAAIVNRDPDGVLQLAIGTTATLALNYAFKALVDKQRPDGTGVHSFPSSHTAMSFEGATFTMRRYGWKWGVPAYAVSCYVAWGRVFAQRHDWWDVLGGAVIGAGSALLCTRKFIPQGLELSPALISDGRNSYCGLTATVTLPI